MYQLPGERKHRFHKFVEETGGGREPLSQVGKLIYVSLPYELKKFLVLFGNRPWIVGIPQVNGRHVTRSLMSWEQLWMDSILKWWKRTKVLRSFKLRIIRKRSIFFRSQTLMSRFASSSKNCDFSCVAKNRKSGDFLCYLRFFAVLCHVNNHWSPERVVDLTKFAKIAKDRKSDDFLRYLRFFAVLCRVNNH